MLSLFGMIAFTVNNFSKLNNSLNKLNILLIQLIILMKYIQTVMDILIKYLNIQPNIAYI